MTNYRIIPKQMVFYEKTHFDLQQLRNRLMRYYKNHVNCDNSADFNILKMRLINNILYYSIVVYQK